MPRAGLSPASVTTRAADLVDEQGWANLTLAQVADAVGVRGPSLYKHVASLDDLRDRVATEATTRLAAALRAAEDDRDRAAALHRLCAAYREFAVAHPGRYEATQRVIIPGSEQAEAAAEVMSIVSAVLARYDIDATGMVDATRTVRAALHGFTALELAGGFGLPDDIDRSFQRLVDGLDRLLATW